MPFEPFHLLRFGLSLPLQKFSDRAAETRIGDIMRRPGRDGAIAARELVPALRARLDAGKSAFDRDVDRAVIRSDEHTSELQSLMRNSYAVFCLKKKNSTTALQYSH